MRGCRPRAPFGPWRPSTSSTRIARPSEAAEPHPIGSTHDGGPVRDPGWRSRACRASCTLCNMRPVCRPSQCWWAIAPARWRRHHDLRLGARRRWPLPHVVSGLARRLGRTRHRAGGLCRVRRCHRVAQAQTAACWSTGARQATCVTWGSTLPPSSLIRRRRRAERYRATGCCSPRLIGANPACHELGLLHRPLRRRAALGGRLARPDLARGRRYHQRLPPRAPGRASLRSSTTQACAGSSVARSGTPRSRPDVGVQPVMALVPTISTTCAPARAAMPAATTTAWACCRPGAAW